MYQENSGIAIIFPSWKLNDIFKQKSFLNRIEELKNKIKTDEIKSLKNQTDSFNLKTVTGDGCAKSIIQ